MTPSLDRKDESLGYSFDNITVMTWKENDEKHHNDVRQGSSNYGVNKHKKVRQLTLEGLEVEVFLSTREAFRSTGIRHISEACHKQRVKTAGGFVWEYVIEN